MFYTLHRQGFIQFSVNINRRIKPAKKDGHSSNGRAVMTAALSAPKIVHNQRRSKRNHQGQSQPVSGGPVVRFQKTRQFSQFQITKFKTGVPASIPTVSAAPGEDGDEGKIQKSKSKKKKRKNEKSLVELASASEVTDSLSPRDKLLEELASRPLPPESVANPRFIRLWGSKYQDEAPRDEEPSEIRTAVQSPDPTVPMAVSPGAKRLKFLSQRNASWDRENTFHAQNTAKTETEGVPQAAFAEEMRWERERGIKVGKKSARGSQKTLYFAGSDQKLLLLNRLANARRSELPMLTTKVDNSQGFATKASRESFTSDEKSSKPTLIRKHDVGNKDKMAPEETPAQTQQPESSTPDPADGTAMDKQISLYELLFPESAKKPEEQIESETPARGSSILPHVFTSEAVDETLPFLSTDAIEATNDSALLILSAADPSLDASDFRRLIPKGKHIDAWRAMGDIQHIIPVRNPTTLQQQTSYILVFKHESHARAYQERIKHIHKLAALYSPSIVELERFPKSSAIYEHEDVMELVRMFTIAHPNQSLRMQMISPPYRGGLLKIVANGGYDNVVSPTSKSGHSVLCWIEGYNPTIESLKRWIAEDGRDRGLQWTPLAGLGGPKSVQELLPPKKGRRGAHEYTETDGVDEDGEETEDHDVQPRQIRRWTIAFEDELEARRFIRTWHGREYTFPLDYETAPLGEPCPKIQTQFIW